MFRYAQPPSCLPACLDSVPSPHQVGNQGGLEALAVDTAGRVLSRTYAQRVALHEAGHFLVAYLLGVLPRGYTLSSLDAFQKWVGKPGAAREAFLVSRARSPDLLGSFALGIQAGTAAV